MELFDSIIFIQGLVWATLLFTGPAQREQRIAGWIILFLTSISMIAYFTDWRLFEKFFLLDLIMLTLYLLVHLGLLYFFSEITHVHRKIWFWLAVCLMLACGMGGFFLEYSDRMIGTQRMNIPVFLAVLSPPVIVFLYSLGIFYLYQMQMNYPGGIRRDRKSVVSIVLLAGLFLTWLLLFLGIQPFVKGELGPGSPFWKVPLAVTLFLFGYLEATARPGVTIRKKDHSSRSENIGSVSLKKILEEEKLYTDCELTLEKMADRLNMAPSALTKMLNQQMGTSFYDLVNGYRVEEVKRLLSNDDQRYYTLLAIAFESGFNSKSTFNRVFKEFTGSTPSEYRVAAAHQTPR